MLLYSLSYYRSWQLGHNSRIYQKRLIVSTTASNAAGDNIGITLLLPIP